MRWAAILALFLLAAALAAQEDDPWRGPKTDVTDAKGRVVITVPQQWARGKLEGTMILRRYAPTRLQMGGHDLHIVREEGMSDPGAQRERYLKYDSAKDTGARIQKVGKPYFGYRIDFAKTNRVFVRAFLTDGDDGLVVTVASRLKFYDKLWADQIRAVVASARLDTGRPGGGSVDGAGSRRVFDEEYRVSFVVPGKWQVQKSSDPQEWLVVARPGKSQKLIVMRQGESFNAARVLGKYLGRVRQNYPGATYESMGDDPPRMLVRGRKEGFVDYVAAYEAAGIGFTLIFNVRESAFAGQRAFADDVAASLVLLGAKHRPPEPPPGNAQAYKKLVVVHAPEGQSDVAAKVAKDCQGFEKAWKKIGFGGWKKASPFLVQLVPAGEFNVAGDYFGRTMAVYNPHSRIVVATLPPEGDDYPVWRSHLYAALADNAVHRDLPARAPAWFRHGIMACAQAAGENGGGPDAPNADLVPFLKSKKPPLFYSVRDWNEHDFAESAKLDKDAFAWGYLHLMLFGKSIMASHYKAWMKTYRKVKRKAPRLNLKKHRKDREDLQKHIDRMFGE